MKALLSYNEKRNSEARLFAFCIAVGGVSAARHVYIIVYHRKDTVYSICLETRTGISSITLWS